MSEADLKFVVPPKKGSTIIRTPVLEGTHRILKKIFFKCSGRPQAAKNSTHCFGWTGVIIP